MPALFDALSFLRCLPTFVSLAVVLAACATAESPPGAMTTSDVSDGGEKPAACADGTWDHDGQTSTACVAWRDCPSGLVVVSGGTPSSDRVCGECPPGQTSAMANATACSPAAWLLSYFGPAQDVAADSLHLAYSVDGQRWTALAQGRPAYQLTGLGSNHIRDPFLFRKNDGTFVYLATDWTLAENDAEYWNHPSSRIFVADSADLVTFTNPRFVTLTDLPGPNGSPMHAWAPEAYYDPTRQAYAIVWSGNDGSDRNRILVSYTRDFLTLIDPVPEVLFDPGYSVIDATIERAGGRSYLFFKDETDGNGPPANRGKDIQLARSASLALAPGAFAVRDSDYVTRTTTQTVRQATEGPFVIFQPENGRWILYADYYLNGGVFGAWVTPSLDAASSAWTRLGDDEFSFPSGVRHAHALRVTQADLEQLIAHYGVSQRVRSTYSESDTPFYLAHSWFHGIITPLADRAAGQVAGDFVWNVVPGLADPQDPALVSFEAFGYPGRYLRVDRAVPERYPSCSEPSNRAWALCWVTEADRHHLLWLDAVTESKEVREDATFRRVPALNGDPAMVSFQWLPEPTRYIRHVAYQVFATPIATSVERNDASFVIERE